MIFNDFMIQKLVKAEKKIHTTFFFFYLFFFFAQKREIFVGNLGNFRKFFRKERLLRIMHI